MILLRIALKTGNVVIISSLSSASIIVATFLANIVFKDKISYKKWFLIFIFNNFINYKYLNFKIE